MFSKKMYVVATTTNLRDVKVENIYDGDVFTLDTILTGLKKKLKGFNIQVSVLGDNAFIDVIDENNELEQSYSIISKSTFISKPYQRIISGFVAPYGYSRQGKK